MVTATIYTVQKLQSVFPNEKLLLLINKGQLATLTFYKKYL